MFISYNSFCLPPTNRLPVDLKSLLSQNSIDSDEGTFSEFAGFFVPGLPISCCLPTKETNKPKKLWFCWCRNSRHSFQLLRIVSIFNLKEHSCFGPWDYCLFLHLGRKITLSYYWRGRKKTPQRETTFTLNIWFPWLSVLRKQEAGG